MQVHRCGVAALDQVVTLRADIRPHHQTVAGVYRRAAHFGLVPMTAHPVFVQGAAGLKPATGEDDSVCRDCLVAHADTGYAPAFGQQFGHTGDIVDCATKPPKSVFLRCLSSGSFSNGMRSATPS